jgi:hypothetical protein
MPDRSQPGREVLTIDAAGHVPVREHNVALPILRGPGKPHPIVVFNI